MADLDDLDAHDNMMIKYDYAEDLGRKIQILINQINGINLITWHWVLTAFLYGSNQVNQLNQVNQGILIHPVIQDLGRKIQILINQLNGINLITWHWVLTAFLYGSNQVNQLNQVNQGILINPVIQDLGRKYKS